MDCSEVGPCLKWVGGKTQILDTVIDKLPIKINNYYEPFAGGGSVFIELLRRVHLKKNTIKEFCVNDINSDLINMYNCIKGDSTNLLSKLNKLNNEYSKARMVNYTKVSVEKTLTSAIRKGKVYVYYYYRYMYNKKKLKGVDRAALFIFLNKTCFRGLHREGPNGFNVSFGNYSNPNIYDTVLIRQLSYLFNKYKVRFYNEDFEKFCKRVKNKTDFVYIDSPYVETFDSYQKGGFNKHKELVEVCNHLNKKGIKFLQSNSWTPWTRKQYKNFKTKKILCKRRINCKNPNDTDYEILINN